MDIVHETGIGTNIPSESFGLPYAVTAHTRTDGNYVYLFVENYSDHCVSGIDLGRDWENILDGNKENICDLSKYGFHVYRRLLK